MFSQFTQLQSEHPKVDVLTYSWPWSIWMEFNFLYQGEMLFLQLCMRPSSCGALLPSGISQVGSAVGFWELSTQFQSGWLKLHAVFYWRVCWDSSLYLRAVCQWWYGQNWETVKLAPPDWNSIALLRASPTLKSASAFTVEMRQKMPLLCSSWSIGTSVERREKLNLSPGTEIWNVISYLVQFVEEQRLNLMVLQLKFTVPKKYVFGIQQEDKTILVSDLCWNSIGFVKSLCAYLSCWITILLCKVTISYVTRIFVTVESFKMFLFISVSLSPALCLVAV